MTWVGGTPLLQTSATIPFQFESGDVRDTVGLLFPIPEDDDLDDSVVVWQSWFLWGSTGVAVSEVFGSRLTGLQQAAAQSSGGGAGRTGTSSRAQKLEALSSMVASRMAAPPASRETRGIVEERLLGARRR